MKKIQYCKFVRPVTVGNISTQPSLNCSRTEDPHRSVNRLEHHVDMEVVGQLVKVTCRQTKATIMVPITNVEYFEPVAEKE